MLTRKMLPVVVLAAALVSGANASEPVTPRFEIAQVTDGIYVHAGREVDIDHAHRGDSANIGFIVGSTCVAVIDTGGSIETGRALLAVIRDHTAVPICYVINTHVHFDHILGNAAFAGEGAEFVGHHNLAADVANSREFFVEHFANELDGGKSELVIGPSKQVLTSMTLDLGARKIVLHAHSTAHSNSDLSVFDEKTATLWTGDLVFIGRLPVVDGSLRGWLAWLAEYQTKSFVRIIPGHGPTTAVWPSAADAEREYLSVLLTGARRAVAEGIYLEDAVGTIGADAASSWRLNNLHARNVSRAFRELEWE